MRKVKFYALADGSLFETHADALNSASRFLEFRLTGLVQHIIDHGDVGLGVDLTLSSLAELSKLGEGKVVEVEKWRIHDGRCFSTYSAAAETLQGAIREACDRLAFEFHMLTHDDISSALQEDADRFAEELVRIGMLKRDLEVE